MHRVRGWVTAAAVVAGLGSLTVSCGSDELTGATGGSANTGGSSGSGGRAGGGSAGKGSGTGGAGTTSPDLGKACTTNASCGQTSGLSCVAGPEVPNGLCSADCTTDANCEAIASGARCHPGGFCLEGCTVGPNTTLIDKCHRREDFGCAFFDALTSTTACTTDAQCGNSAICDTDTGTCINVVTTCQPVCGSDDECGSNFCNVGSGLCQATPPTGRQIGSACNPNAATEECAGTCIGDSAGEFTLCTGSCVFGASTGCGWNGVGPAAAGCIFTPIFIAEPDLGDVLWCGQLCDCDADCLNTNSQCISFGTSAGGQSFIDFYHRKGFCAPADPMDVTLPECTGAGGGGGAGGDGAGGASGGTAGEAGSGGTGGTGGTSSGGVAGSDGSGGASGGTSGSAGEGASAG